MVHLISYDLRGHERPSAYEGVARVIVHYAPDHRRPLYSQWLVNTSDSPDVWWERLRRVTDSNDRLLIARVRASEARGWLSKQDWDWLQARA